MPAPEDPQAEGRIVASGIFGGTVAASLTVLILGTIFYFAANADRRTTGSGQTPSLSDQQSPPKDHDFQR